jgi:hypothetical protein
MADMLRRAKQREDSGLLMTLRWARGCCDHRVVLDIM